MDAYSDYGFEERRKDILATLGEEVRIPTILRRGLFLYNLWRDADRPRGVWRRATFAEFRSPEPVWEIVLDMDALALAEGRDWVFRGCFSLPPDHRHCLLQLSVGGSDAVVIREFDLIEKRFVAEGFSLPLAKGYANWLDRDTVLVTSALGDENRETSSGYARTVRKWRRGTDFASSTTLFEGELSDLGTYGWHYHAAKDGCTLFLRKIDFDRHTVFIQRDSQPLQQLNLPDDAEFAIQPDSLILNLKSDWLIGQRRYEKGSLLAIGLTACLAGSSDFTRLFVPSGTQFLEQLAVDRDTVAFSVLDDIRQKLFVARQVEGSWQVEPKTEFDRLGSLDVSCLSSEPSYWFKDDTDWFSYPDSSGRFSVVASSSVDPPKLWLAGFGGSAELLKSQGHSFDSSSLQITQHRATSPDGVEVPYFQIAHIGIALDGSCPVLMTGYGGFNASSLPRYDPIMGRLWLQQGGVFVIANIRGGGELGPDWHKANMREGKRRSHDDFATVAEDLVRRQVTVPRKLLCRGSSNGGLLVGNMLTRFPNLFAGIHCTVPLLDMKRYSKLLAGSSWISEYGNPDLPEDWNFLKEISPYHNISSDRDYPPILLTTNGRDDRVHPSHARKMAAALIKAGHRAFYYEFDRGGHAGTEQNDEVAFLTALAFSFLWRCVESGPKTAGYLDTVSSV